MLRTDRHPVAAGPGLAAHTAPRARAQEEVPLGSLARVLSHRIRNLLAGIEGCADLLGDTLGTREQRELVLRILEGSTRIEGLLADVQRYSEPVEAVPSPIALRSVVERLLLTLDDDALAAFTLDLPEERCTLLADPALLHQALLLLVQNALDAATAVTLRVRIDHEPRRAIFHVWNPGALALDGGAERAFDPFVTTKPDALGLGLWMARRIAEAHGGRLHLVSHDAEAGTCFAFEIPLPTEPSLCASGTPC